MTITFTATASDIWDAAYLKGSSGQPLTATLEFFRGAIGILADWQTGAVVAGHAFGCQDYVNYLADLAAVDPWSADQSAHTPPGMPPF